MQGALQLALPDYQLFVGAAPAGRHVGQDLWDRVHATVEWTGLTPAKVHAALVLCLVRELAKVKDFRKSVPKQAATSPEEVELYVQTKLFSLLPEVGRLDMEMQKLAALTLEATTAFKCGAPGGGRRERRGGVRQVAAARL